MEKVEENDIDRKEIDFKQENDRRASGFGTNFLWKGKDDKRSSGFGTDLLGKEKQEEGLKVPGDGEGEDLRSTSARSNDADDVYFPKAKDDENDRSQSFEDEGKDDDEVVATGRSRDDKGEEEEPEMLFVNTLRSQKDDAPPPNHRYSIPHSKSAGDLFKRPITPPVRDDYVHFQRVKFCDPVEHDDKEAIDAARKIRELLKLRDKYVYKKPARYWGSYDAERYQKLYDEDTAIAEAQGRWRKDMPFFARTGKRAGSHPFNVGRRTKHRFRRSCGVFKVYIPGEDLSEAESYYRKPVSVHDFYADLGKIVKLVNSGPVRSLAYKRIQLLDARFDLHQTLNLDAELAEQKRVRHRDFYNVRKVDTHVHHSSFMTQKHLLRFIKAKLRKFPGDKVLEIPDGVKSELRDSATAAVSDDAINLAQLFQSLRLGAYDLSVDTLDMHAHHKTFKRFDRFNQKYNPIGRSNLRTVFLKYDNYIKGRYLAELTREVFDDLELNKYSYSEPRVSVYGRSENEFHVLGQWYYDHDLASKNIRWMVQIPRLYQVWKSKGMVHDFGEMIGNIFRPLFEVTADPSSDPKLAAFLEQVVAFDCVDDESKLEPLFDPSSLDVPENWTSEQNPPYSYWMYYIYANLIVLNRFRAHKGLSTFSLRPHAGEAGGIDHLAVAYLVAEHINHGIRLKDSPPLQYLFYLHQIGLAMSPLSNNKLFLEYNKNPFVSFFKRGLNVSLSTDDPLQFHYTKEPLVEEYCVAAQVWKLTACDMCEIARNSVLQSGFEYPYKRHYLGDSYYKYPHPDCNNIELTNVANIRVRYRYEVLQNEIDFLEETSQIFVSDGGSRKRTPLSPMSSSLRKVLDGTSTPVPFDATRRFSAVQWGGEKVFLAGHGWEDGMSLTGNAKKEEDEQGCILKCRPSALCAIQ
eukprot:g557.t1